MGKTEAAGRSIPQWAEVRLILTFLRRDNFGIGDLSNGGFELGLDGGSGQFERSLGWAAHDQVALACSRDNKDMVELLCGAGQLGADELEDGL